MKPWVRKLSTFLFLIAVVACAPRAKQGRPTSSGDTAPVSAPEEIGPPPTPGNPLLV
jgi:hypothetical protein